MRLTSDLVAQVMLNATDTEPGPMPAGRRPATEADLQGAVRNILASAPPRDQMWIFAYGSLIWNPCFDHVERRTGIVRGWHRSFCLGWDRWFRGSEKWPGLMLALDQGGQCNGIVFRLPADGIEENLLELARREIRLIPHSFPARWINVSTGEGSVRALTFAMDRTAPGYVGRLSPAEVADALAMAVGQFGSMAEYLRNTVVQLEELGLRDRNLWRLQAMVAERIERAVERRASSDRRSP
ncbi:MAG: gamma-glutamylcyclotransferase [Mesorhizobium sp.]|nr:MAG: gamma-glutamylcyclotransferase [Mesorhizobium sp.]